MGESEVEDAWVRKVGRVVCEVVRGERGRGWRWVGLVVVVSGRVRMVVEGRRLHDCIEVGEGW